MYHSVLSQKIISKELDVFIFSQLFCFDKRDHA